LLLERVFHAGFSQEQPEHREVIVIVVGGKDNPRNGLGIRRHKSVLTDLIERTWKSDTP
jgi:hypothetical protein